ncbi:MAG TPA: glycosyltransferase, partial [Terriglobales bacterium]|nr:glycosyltransferase [Terriglobales bacterium]
MRKLYLGQTMETAMDSPVCTLTESSDAQSAVPGPPIELGVALLTGGFDRPYAYGLAMVLASQGVRLDVIGSDEVDSPEMHTTAGLRFVNLRRRHRRDTTLAGRLWMILSYYARLIRYTAVAQPRIFHILWNNKFQLFDRTLLMMYYKAQGKKIVLTAHNVNQGKRDSNDSLLNRVTLRIQYRIADHIFVHTSKMKDELIADFGVRERAVTTIRHPINNAFPDTDLTCIEAKARLGIGESEKTILFFGRISAYKGIE